jgi:hypothetical protein
MLDSEEIKEAAAEPVPYAAFDINGFFIGLVDGYRDAYTVAALPPEGIDLSVARWDGSEWKADESRNQAKSADVVLYEYDDDGWLVGTHSDAARKCSTTTAPDGIASGRARWNGAGWISDASRETQEAAAKTAEADRVAQAVARCKSYDPATATASDVSATLAALLLLLKQSPEALR